MATEDIWSAVVSMGMPENQNKEIEAELQALSRGLTHLIFRNVQLVEEIHVKQMPIKI